MARSRLGPAIRHRRTKKVQELNLSGCEFGENFLCKGGSRVSNANVGGSDPKQPPL
jgi:hypothetical protein